MAPVLTEGGQSRKRKRNEDESLPEIEEHASEGASSKKPKKSKKVINTCIKEEMEVDTEQGDSKSKKEKKNKKSLKHEKDSLVAGDKQPKKQKKIKEEKMDDDAETGNSQPKKENNNKLDDEESQLKKEKLNKTEKLIKCVLDNLHQWKNDVKSWTFSKYYQSHLINIINDPTIVNEEDFETSLQYLKRVRGNAKKKLKMKATAVVNGEEESETNGNGMDATDEKKKQKKKDMAKSVDESCTLFVKNLPYGQTFDELRSGLMKIFTTASNIRMPFRNSAKHIGFAFVEFSHVSEVTSALSEKQGVKLHGRSLFLDRVGSKNKSLKSGYRRSLSPEFIATERQRRAEQILQMLHK